MALAEETEFDDVPAAEASVRIIGCN